MTVLLPRMSKIAVDTTLAMLSKNVDIKDIQSSLAQLPNWVTYAAVGGTRATNRELADLREMLNSIAKECQETAASSQSARSMFDARTAQVLALHPLFNSGEALRDDVWAFVSTYIALSSTIWRFGAGSADRFHGGVRNTFQRLWLRGSALDRGENSENRWVLLTSLSEDAMVAITERPSVASNPRIACGIAEGWVRWSNRVGRGAMEPIMRRAVMGIRLRNEVYSLSSLSQEDLAIAIDEEFRKAAPL
jgi:hypothetical protein